jgi:hypothetical protein
MSDGPARGAGYGRREKTADAHKRRIVIVLSTVLVSLAISAQMAFADSCSNGATSSLLGVGANCRAGADANRQTTQGIQSGCQ